MPRSSAQIIKEGKLLAEINQSRRATDALTGITGEYIKNKKAQIFEAFQQIPATDGEALKHLKLQYEAVEGLEKELEQYIDSGTLAQHEFENLGVNDE